MKYNPKAKLNEDQVQFKRGRASGHTYTDRFSVKAEGAGKSEQQAVMIEAMRRRLKQKMDRQ